VVNLRLQRGVESLAEHFAALAALRDAGLIRHLGVSGVTPEQLAEAPAIAPVVCVQNRYGIGASPSGHAFVDACGAEGIAFVPFFTIAGQGGGAGATGPDHAEVRAVAQAHGASAAQVRLAWALHRGSHVLVIPRQGRPRPPDSQRGLRRAAAHR
jgi:pyridoxine 4-dehydrogenase